MRNELPGMVIGGLGRGARRPSEARESPVSFGPSPRPSDSTEGAQRGSQGHERESWYRIGGQQSYQVHGKASRPSLWTRSITPSSFHPPVAHSSPILASTRGESPGSSRSSRSSALTTRIPSVSLS